MYRQRNTLMGKVGAFWLFLVSIPLAIGLIYIVVALATTKAH